MLAMVLVVLAASGDQQRGFGAGVGMTSDFADLQGTLNAKFYASDKVAARFLLGVSSFSNGATETDLRIGGGVEYHWKPTKVSPYVAAQLIFASLDSAGEATVIAIFGGFGAEYWIERNLTIAGEGGLAYVSTSNGADITGFTTGQTSLRMTYYF